MRSAFYYMFKDSFFAKKVLKYAIFALIANLLYSIGYTFVPNQTQTVPIQYYILSTLGFVVMLIPNGYIYSCIKAIMEQNDNVVLPFLNVKTSFIQGFKFMLCIVLFLLIFSILYIPLCFIFAFLQLPALFTASAFVLVGALLVLPYVPVIMCIFAKKGWITSFVRIIKATKIIKKDFVNYFKYTLLFFVLVVLNCVVNSLITKYLSQNIVSAIINAVLLTAVSSYLVYVYAYIVAKSTKAEFIE